MNKVRVSDDPDDNRSIIFTNGDRMIPAVDRLHERARGVRHDDIR
jgi:hypothetical protein